MELPERFVARVRARLKEDAEKFLATYESASFERAIRVNTLKITPQEFEKISPFALQPVPWEESGFYAGGDRLGKTVLHAAGLYYVQEPSAMCAAPLLDVRQGERVLDLCAAPGGKGTQLAQKMNGKGIIVLNEINFPRAKILSQNVERLGITNAVVTCAPPEAVAREFNGYFDKVLVDAPCSGEGMFRKEPNALPEWSEENVIACASRQKEILISAAKCVKSGGRLVYSTCTFSEEEDEWQVEDFLGTHKNFKLLKQHKLYPHEVRGEGHFAALLEKTEGDGSECKLIKPKINDKNAAELFAKFAECLRVGIKNLHSIGENLYALPDNMPEIRLQILRAGIHLGTVKGKVFQPSHSLAMCLNNSQADTVEVGEEVALRFLSGETFACDSANGWKVVTYLGYPLGWCKVVDGTAKNHLPKGLRI